MMNSNPRERRKEGNKKNKTKTEGGDGSRWITGVGCPPLSFNPSNSLD